MTEPKEDVHFYIDSAPLEEVKNVLRVLSTNEPLSNQDIQTALLSIYGFEMQADITYSPRRLYDLGLTETATGKVKKYTLTKRGEVVQQYLSADDNFASELLHYLHYTLYSSQPTDRKLLWSYRRCSNYLWQARQLIPSKELTAQIQSDITAEFSHISDLERTGGRFKNANQGVNWIKALQPSPFDEDGQLQPRSLDNYQLVLLALDDFYRHEGYAYDMALLLDDEALDKVARVFFMDISACRDLIPVAAALSDAITLFDTLAGTAVTLHTPYGIENL